MLEAGKFFGVDRSMDTFVGRQKNDWNWFFILFILWVNTFDDAM